MSNFIRPTRISLNINLFILMIIENFPFLVSFAKRDFNFNKFESHVWEILHSIFNYIYKQNHIEWKSKDQGHCTHQKNLNQIYMMKLIESLRQFHFIPISITRPGDEVPVVSLNLERAQLANIKYCKHKKY